MRSTAQRKSDAIDKLRNDDDVWFATADDRGTAHLVPLSLCWHDAGPEITGAYRERTGWEPGSDGGDWVYILLKPTRIQVWRNVDEITGRTVMADGTWLA